MFCYGNWSKGGCMCGAIHLQNFGIRDIISIIGKSPRNINDIIKLTILKDDPAVFQTLAPHLMVDWPHVIRLAATQNSYQVLNYFIEISALLDWDYRRLFAEICISETVDLEKIDRWIHYWPSVIANLYRKNKELQLLLVANTRTQDGALQSIISSYL